MNVYENKNGFRWQDFQVERQGDDTLFVRNTRTGEEIKIESTEPGFKIVVNGELEKLKETTLNCPYCNHPLESHERVSDSIQDGSKCNVEGCNCHRKPEGSI